MLHLVSMAPVMDADMVLLNWEYNVTRKRWEATVGGWCASATRWARGTEWTATIESLDRPNIRYIAGHVFVWVEGAQAWCVSPLVRRGSSLGIMGNEGSDQSDDRHV
jgi:hypothetical protein